MASRNIAPPDAHRRAIQAKYELKAHRSYADARDGNSAVNDAGPKLRQYARHLDQNHDLVKGALDRLTQFIVGASGIGIEPQPRTLAGDVHADFSRQLLEVWRDWTDTPEVTWQHTWSDCQRLLCRTWLRDGEALIHLVQGNRPDLDHGTRVPFSLELLEPDYLAFAHTDHSARIIHSVEVNAWGRPKNYWLYKQHPGGLYSRSSERKPVSAERLLHLKMTDRIGQVRGVSILASVLHRMNDLFEYENAERLAARIAASLTGILKTENGGMYTPATDDAPREFNLQPGMILDNLRPGESLDMVSSNRPSPTLEAFRNGQLRAAAAGLGLSYSALARDYNGTYSAQRQELVEQFDAYRILSQQFIGAVNRPIWQTFVRLALLNRVVTAPVDIDPLTLDDASFQPPAIPWIDPAKEASAQSEQLANYLTSPQTLIRQHGGNPDTLLDDHQKWNEALKQRGLSTPPSTPARRNPATDEKTA